MAAAAAPPSGWWAWLAARPAGGLLHQHQHPRHPAPPGPSKEDQGARQTSHKLPDTKASGRGHQPPGLGPLLA